MQYLSYNANKWLQSLDLKAMVGMYVYTKGLQGWSSAA
jgi:hypothetical protein